LVESIDDGDLQRRRGWDLSGWRYHLVPWGVRFTHDGPHYRERAEVTARTGLEGTFVYVEARPPRADAPMSELHIG
jgi:hypothetical protein